MIKKYYKYAYAEYGSNVYQFINTGEGRSTGPHENLKIRTKYPEVNEWYLHLDRAGKQRIDRYLVEKYDRGSI